MFAWYFHYVAKAFCSSMADFSKWAQKHLSRVGEDFEEVDKDKSGSLDFFEVYNVLQKSGFKGTLEEAKVRRTWFITTPSKIFQEFVHSV